MQAYLKVLGQDGAKVAESLEEKGLAALKDVAHSLGGRELLTKIGVGAAALGSGIVGASLDQGKELIGRIAAPAWEAAADAVEEIEAARDQHPGERATITALRDGGADVQVSAPQHVQHAQAQQAVSR